VPGHALRGMLSAGLVLIVIETLATSKTGQVGSFFTDANKILQRAFSPNVPLIPDRRTGAPATSGGGGYFTGLTPAENQAITDAQKLVPGTPAAIDKAFSDPNSLLSQLAQLNLVGVDHLGAYSH
jgi:hypothetical protein